MDCTFNKSGDHVKFKLTDQIKLKLAENDPIPPETIIGLFKKTVNAFPTRKALIYSDKNKNMLQHLTWQSYWDICKIVAKGFAALGLQKGETVGIMGFNSHQWLISNMATIMTGAVPVGIYSTYSTSICKYILNDANCSIVVVENEELLNKLLTIKNETKVRYFILYDDIVSDRNKGEEILEWEQFMKYSYNLGPVTEIADLNQIKPNQCATLIYTSGTTGNPKGVMLSHDSIIWTTKVISLSFNINTERIEKIVSYLPLSDIVAQIWDIYLPLLNASETWFADKDALKGTLINTLKLAKPTIFLGVPRVWEKMKESMMNIGRNNSIVKKFVAKHAKKEGMKNHFKREKGKEPNLRWLLFDKIVYNKIKTNLGLESTRLFLSGAAPLSREVSDYFASLNMQIFDIYGMSESTGPMTICHPSKWKSNSCGIPLLGTQIVIAPNNEILIKGRHLMMGYLNSPEKTKEAIDSDGFLHTGDTGYVDSEGFVFLTGTLNERLVLKHSGTAKLFHYSL